MLDELKVSLWPSEQEIRDSTCEDAYLAGLTEFYASIDELENGLRDKAVSCLTYTGVYRQKGKLVHRALPPEVAELLLRFIEVAGSGAIIYNIFKPWVDLKNGRKFRVKTGGMEVEATQLSEKQFMKLLSMVEDHEKKKREEILEKGLDKFEKTIKRLDKAMIDRLRSEGFPLCNPKSLDYDDESFKLHQLLLESRMRAESRLRMSHRKRSRRKRKTS